MRNYEVTIEFMENEEKLSKAKIKASAVNRETAIAVAAQELATRHKGTLYLIRAKYRCL